jgi:methylmalonyl-CoA/ethylmalonyl-CoA epimerase
MKFHHIGVAVKSIDKTASIYVEAGYKQSQTIFDPIQDVNICWLTKAGMPTIELLEPVDVNSPVNKTLEKNGVAPYHTCYVVEDIEQSIAALKQRKYIIMVSPVKAPAITNCKIAFLFNRNVGVIELVEAPADITI